MGEKMRKGGERRGKRRQRRKKRKGIEPSNPDTNFGIIEYHNVMNIER